MRRFVVDYGSKGSALEDGALGMFLSLIQVIQQNLRGKDSGRRVPYICTYDSWLLIRYLVIWELPR